MDKEQWIALRTVTRVYELDDDFVSALKEFGLLQVERQEDEDFIPARDLGELERVIRLHHDLDINLEGIDVIHHLLGRIDELQQEVRRLKSGQGSHRPNQ